MFVSHKKSCQIPTLFKCITIAVFTYTEENITAKIILATSPSLAFLQFLERPHTMQ